MTRIASKFGGTSVASAAQLRKVQAIVEADSRRRIIVPSAPGKRVPTEPKITDLLYLCHEMAAFGTDFRPTFSRIRERFLEIESELGVQSGVEEELSRFEEELASGCGRDYAASRGEYFNGRILAALLDAELVDPKDSIRISSLGGVDPKTYELLGQRLAGSRRYVVPGFYGCDSRGRIKTFSRGGSDITGAIAARAAGAELYENWTDVSGLLMTDPRIVDSPRPMTEVTYRELRELAYMGATVLHDEAILPVREVGIPVNIRNTNEPDHPGTRIVPKLSEIISQTTEIAGIAGRRGFAMIGLEKSLMNKEVGFAARLLQVFARRGVSVEHCPSSIDGIHVICDKEQFESMQQDLLEELERVFQPDKLSVEPEIALIAVVGEGMNHTIGIAAKVFIALRDAKVNVRVINQGASELNIIVGVVPDEFDRAVRALYDAFVPRAVAS